MVDVGCKYVAPCVGVRESDLLGLADAKLRLVSWVGVGDWKVEGETEDSEVDYENRE